MTIDERRWMDRYDRGRCQGDMFTAWAMYDTLLRLREAEEALSRARAKLDAAGRAA